MTKLQVLRAISNLRTDRTNSWPDTSLNQAPHKPLLLLSVVDGIEQGWIAENRISLDERLIDQFGAYWGGVMDSSVPTIANPYYHLQSSDIWDLHFKDSKPTTSGTPSVFILQMHGAFVRLDPMLYDMMCNAEDRAIIRQTILQKYFSEQGIERLSLHMRFDAEAFLYITEIDHLVDEPFQLITTAEVIVSYTTVTKEARERGFSIRIRDLYRNTCAICRSRVVTPQGYTLVDAAHVWPRAISRNDDPRNGLALCKTHHWMFDQYLLTVTTSYEIHLSRWIKANGYQIDDTLKLDGNPLLLPTDRRFNPAVQAIEMHNSRFNEING